MVTVKVLFAGLLIVAFAPSQGLVPDKVPSARDAEVVRAIQEELLTPTPGRIWGSANSLPY